MFTGIVEELGRVRHVGAGAEQPNGAAETGAGPVTRMVFDAPAVSAGVAVGDSIAVDGCCLTVVDHGDGWWAGEAVAETLSRTTLGRRRPGDPVNLERPMAAAGRFGGHLVQGHVDAVGTVVAAAPELRVRVPSSLVRYLVAKGSIAVDGCSLTVVEALDDGFTVAVIPHTAAVTTLGLRRPGDEVNIEVDVVAKYVERLLAADAPSPYVQAPSHLRKK